MKAFLPAVLFFWMPAFGQGATNTTDDALEFSVVVEANTYGYVNGIRLDSVNATYSEFWRRLGEGLYFDYGQKRDKRREMIITNKNGKRLVFEPDTKAAFLNFFAYNGWQLDRALTASDGNVSSFILIKKQ